MVNLTLNYNQTLELFELLSARYGVGATDIPVQSALQSIHSTLKNELVSKLNYDLYKKWEKDINAEIMRKNSEIVVNNECVSDDLHCASVNELNVFECEH